MHVVHNANENQDTNTPPILEQPKIVLTFTQEELNTINSYINFVPTTAVYPKQVSDFSLAYITLGIIDELLELEDVLEELRKFIHQEYQQFLINEVSKTESNTEIPISIQFTNLIEQNEDYKKLDSSVRKEAGDVLWYITNLGLIYLTKEELSDIVRISLDITRNMSHLDNVNIDLIYGKVKKHYRDDKPIDLEYIKLYLEYHYTNISTIFRNTKVLLEIMNMNIEKLSNRQSNNTLKGSGDDR